VSARLLIVPALKLQRSCVSDGAGKTTMVSMLAGLEEADSGDGWIEQTSIVTDLDAARRRLGLCPQFDALRECSSSNPSKPSLPHSILVGRCVWSCSAAAVLLAVVPNLTAREHLNMFAKVRGVPPEMRPRIVERTIQEMGLSLKADCRVDTYSGGNKRKLSVALSMVSDPAVSFLVRKHQVSLFFSRREKQWTCLDRLGTNKQSVSKQNDAGSRCRRMNRVPAWIRRHGVRCGTT
jgi:ATP-binding cassette subfamily A (ABC1) protein 3